MDPGSQSVRLGGGATAAAAAGGGFRPGVLTLINLFVHKEYTTIPSEPTQTPTDFASLLDEYTFAPPVRGDIIDAEIVDIIDGTVFVDIGASRDAIVPHEDLAQLGDNWLDKVSTGDQVPVRVMQTPDEAGRLIVSIEKGLAVRDWERAQKLLDDGDVVELKIVGYNKGGLLVEFGFLEGFIPNSHVPDIRGLRDRRLLQERKGSLIDTTMPVKVLEINVRNERLLFSGTHAASVVAESRFNELEEGQELSGTVVNLVKFGAFVELGGVQGLIHISNLAWEKVSHPSEVISVGDEVKVRINAIDRDRQRINLSRKALLPSPWEMIADTYSVGDLVTGRVANIVDFGVFVRLDEGVEGLVHESEMLNYQRELLQQGDEVLTRIIRIQPDQRRIGLSLRAVTTEEELAWMAERRVDEEE